MNNNLALNQNVTREIKESFKFKFIIVYCAFLIMLGFILNSPAEIANGMISLLQSPSVLISDYMVIGGLGATFVNAGLVGLIGISLVKIEGIKASGPIIAAIFTMVGFALFGKNILNIWPIFLGVYIYSRVKKERFGKFILPALFGTTLGPLVSQLAFSYNFSLILGLFFGFVFGTIAGFLLPPLSAHLLNTHKGYNIYNLGFTGGIVGTLFMALFRGHGIDSNGVFIWGVGFNNILVPIFGIYFASMIVVGFLLDNSSIKALKDLFKNPGTLITDFTDINGFAPSIINMGLVGLIGLGYIVIVGGDLNGPTLGALYTIVGFGAFGKHVKNIIPIIIGVYFGTLFKVWSPSDPGALLAALFGTTLAPIAGTFGPIMGIIAGFLHLSMVMNVGFLHGGVNLYNNGFAGGIVAAIMIGVLSAFPKRD